MKALVKSSAGLSLYYYIDDYATDHFYIKKSDSIDELILNAFFLDLESGKMKATESTYLLQLGSYTNDCSSGMKANKLTYKASPLQNFIKEYNLCKAYHNSFLADIERITFEPDIFIGFTRSNLTITEIEEYNISEADFTTSTNITAGISLNILFPKSRKHWSLYSQLLYKELQVSSIYDEQGAGFTMHHEYEFSFAYAKLLNAIRYQHEYLKIKPFIYAGFTNGYAFKSEQLHTYQAYYSSGLTGELQTEKPFDNLSPYEIGYGIGGGFTLFGHIALSISNEWSNSTTVHGSPYRISSLYFTLGFVF
ncbi:MAG: outer membrane beta-barrel protein [Fimbriimonadaceae bacterium]|nr:outer membrane beta-barrel protein [Chitinophagales bacterium]